ncbi:MarR family winged helix-turn-helix transcriptional regulator [Microvirga pakistanensis]|uniref:MarR family winged helix-turn-helix transcriptional regulator n=1 Tax=Microvirga pakistanensis TaxID=1682650 RepID=UPI00106CA073|nr:MarR family transcriptional regulator [Microvirga pakistanensis]
MLDRCLGLRLQRAARVVARRLDEAPRPLDLTNGQFELLALLRQTPAQGIASVAERLGRERTTTTAILKPLKQRGLVAVTVNPDDSRGRRLSLTRAGRDLLAAATPIGVGLVPAWSIISWPTGPTCFGTAWNDRRRLKAV